MFHVYRNFLIKQFEQNPSYSFKDASLMIDHSLNVHEIAININHVAQGDFDLVYIGSMFHDIGKTKMIDGRPLSEQVLRKQHEAFNFEIIEPMLKSNKIEAAIIEDLENMFTTGTKTLEGKIIKDADIIEFYMNRRLQTALNSWAQENGISNELQRKADKFNVVLHFDISKEIARPYWNIMKEYWGLS